MTVIINDILNYLNTTEYKYSFYGNMNQKVEGYGSLNNISDSWLIFIKNLSNFDAEILNRYHDLLVVSQPNPNFIEQNRGHNFIFCEHPKKVFFDLLNKFFKDVPALEVKTNSVILTKEIGENFTIGLNCLISKKVKIGNNVIIKNNVVIEENSVIGNDIIIESGTVIGMTGFGYYKDARNYNKRIDHFGGVIIGDKTEIGANVTIEKGTLDNTLIGENVIIGNTVNIGHNSIIGDKTMILAKATLLGSSSVGEDSYVAPCAVIGNQIIKRCRGINIYANKNLEVFISCWLTSQNQIRL